MELSRNPSIQTKLREELLAYDGEPNYDQLSSSLPYLDAVVHETLWLHSPVTELIRIIRSLSSPLYLTLTSHVSGNRGRCDTLSELARTRSGDLVDSITSPKERESVYRLLV